MRNHLSLFGAVATLGLAGVLLVASMPSEVDAFAFPRPLLGDTIAGVVLDGDGDPVAGIRVRLDGPVSGKTKTDSDGNFQFSDLLPGGYTVSVCDGADSTNVSLACCDVFVWLTASCAG